jgi:hypothetical protein
MASDDAASKLSRDSESQAASLSLFDRLRRPYALAKRTKVGKKTLN